MLQVCLWFDRAAEDAAAFYTSVLRDGSIGRTVRYLDPDPTPSNRPGEVMTVEWEAEGMRFLGLNGGPNFTFNEAISLIVTRDTQEELDEVWDALTDGGSEGPCGWCTDRFGVSWQVVPRGWDDIAASDDTEGVRRAMEALLQMKKLDIAELRRAFEGAHAAH